MRHASSIFYSLNLNLNTLNTTFFPLHKQLQMIDYTFFVTNIKYIFLLSNENEIKENVLQFIKIYSAIDNNTKVF